MKTAQILPLTLLAGVAVTVTHGCHLRGDINKLNPHNKNVDLNEPLRKNGLTFNARVPQDLQGLPAVPARGSGALTAQAQVYRGVTKNVDANGHQNPASAARDKKRAVKIETPEEIVRHREAALLLSRDCADEMEKYVCKIGFMPARCLRKHPLSDRCGKALVSWYQGEPKASFDETPLEQSFKSKRTTKRKSYSRLGHGKTDPEGSMHDRIAHGHRGPHPGRHDAHVPHVHPPHHKRPLRYGSGGGGQSMDSMVRDRPPRSSFTVLMDWINGVDSSDSGDSSSSDSDETSSFDSGDSSDSHDSWELHHSPRHGHDHHHHRTHHMPAPSRSDIGKLGYSVPRRHHQVLDADEDHDEFPFDSFGTPPHHHGRHGKHAPHNHEYGPDHHHHHHHLHGQGDGQQLHENDDFMQSLLGFFFFVGIYTLVLLPFILLARAIRRMARRRTRSRSSVTPPGPSSSAFGGLARRRESDAAAAAAAAAGYQALPEEPTAAAAAAVVREEDEDEDAIVVTGTPVNPPPSVNV